MEVTFIGIICLAACVVVFAQPIKFGLYIFAFFLPLQTAAAVNLWSIGGTSIICSHLMIGAFVLAILLRPSLYNYFWAHFMNSKPSILLAMFIAYAIFSALFMPIFFNGDMLVFSFERPPEGEYIIPKTQLHRTTGNMTQPIYIIANLVNFAIISALLSRPGGLRHAARMMGVITIVHIVFGYLSAISDVGPIAVIFDTIRTANYAILTHHEIAGFKRLIGSYTEASVFGMMSVGLLAFNAVRYMQTRRLRFGIYSVLLALGAIGSLSTTAYAAIAFIMLLGTAQAMVGLVTAGLRKEDLTLFVINAAIGVLMILLLFYPPAQDMATTFYEKLFGSKLASQSGVERGSWNLQAYRNFIESYGLGVGLGSARASSLLMALLSNVGILGFVLYVLFLITSVFKTAPRLGPHNRTADTLAARNMFIAIRSGALALMIAQLISASAVDQGLLFMTMAAMASVFGDPRYIAKLGAAESPVRSYISTAATTTAPQKTRGRIVTA